jgi:hypothetical protein
MTVTPEAVAAQELPTRCASGQQNEANVEWIRHVMGHTIRLRLRRPWNGRLAVLGLLDRARRGQAAAVPRGGGRRDRPRPGDGPGAAHAEPGIQPRLSERHHRLVLLRRLDGEGVVPRRRARQRRPAEALRRAAAARGAGLRRGVGERRGRAPWPCRGR